MTDNSKRKEHGIVLPIFSLPGRYGVGDIASLRNLIQRLKHFPVDVVQLLPLNALGPFEISPYSSISAFGNELLYIDIDSLPISSMDLELSTKLQNTDYALARRIKSRVLKNAFRNFIHTENDLDRASFEAFKNKQKHWLNSYSCFHRLLDKYGCAYWDWPKHDRNFLSTHEIEESEFYAYVQWIFYTQWQILRSEAKQAGIRLMGDLPIYVSKNSADAWANPELFQNGIHAGVPPDLYSEDGQDWGNPIYDWELMEKYDFQWWRQRMNWLNEYFDLVRIDHIRGLHDYWAVQDGSSPKDTKDWTEGPRDGILKAFLESDLEIIGEDLGLITDDVDQWMRKFDIPGYRVFIFGWGWYADQGENYGALKYKDPKTYSKQCLSCSSTHDSESLFEFIENLSHTQVQDLCDFFDCGSQDLRKNILISLRDCPSKYVIHPLQDLLDLPIRINTPGTVGEKNWTAIIPLESLEQRLFEYFSW